MENSLDFIPPDLFPAHLKDGTEITVDWDEYQELQAQGLLSSPTPDTSTSLTLDQMYNRDELPSMGQLR